MYMGFFERLAWAFLHIVALFFGIIVIASIGIIIDIVIKFLELP